MSEQAEPTTYLVTVSELTGDLDLYGMEYTLEQSLLCKSMVSSSALRLEPQYCPQHCPLRSEQTARGAAGITAKAMFLLGNSSVL